MTFADGDELLGRAPRRLSALIHAPLVEAMAAMVAGVGPLVSGRWLELVGARFVQCSLDQIFRLRVADLFG
jgi:hypothetical protein